MKSCLIISMSILFLVGACAAEEPATANSDEITPPGSTTPASESDSNEPTNNEEDPVVYDFQREEHLRLLGDSPDCGYQNPVVLLDQYPDMEAVEMTGLTPPYEIRGVSLGLIAEGVDYLSCATNAPITLFAYVGDEGPQADATIATFAEYSGDGPFAFPSLPNVVSGIISKDTASNPGVIEGNSNWAEVSLLFEEPLVVTEETKLWVGYALYQDTPISACVLHCDGPDSGGKQIFYSGSWREQPFNEFNTPSFGVIVGLE